MERIIASDGYIGITDIIYDIEDSVVLSSGEDCIIYYNETIPYFIYNNVKYYLNEFIKTDI